MNFAWDDHETQTPQRPRLRLNLLAVVSGAITDVSVTYMLVQATVIAVAISLAHSGLFSDIIEVVEEVRQVFEEPFTVGCMIVLGTLCTVLGGFVSASLARRDFLQHAFATGLVVLVYGFVMDIMAHLQQQQPPPQSGWYQAMSHLIVIPAAMLGGWLRQPRLPRLQMPQSDFGGQSDDRERR